MGKELCRVLGYTFFDSDDMVVELTGRAIADIFQEQGEDAFRDLETQMLQVRGGRQRAHARMHARR